MKKVSVIMPIYNCEKYLKRSIESIINQTYNCLEIILINDGSTDNSLNICVDYSKNDNRIKIIDKKNEGVSQARNDGIKKATGEYIFFMDSDDWIDSNTIEICMKEIGNFDLLMFPYIKEFSNKSIIRRLFESEFEANSWDEVYKKVFLDYIGPYNTNISSPELLDIRNAVWGKVFKTKIAKKIEFVDFKKIISEDLLYNIMYVKKIKTAKYIEKTFYHYNKCNTSSISKKSPNNLILRWKNLFSYIEKEIFVENNDIELNCLNNRIALNMLHIALQVYNCSISLKEKINNLNILLSDEYFTCRYKYLDLKKLSFKMRIFYKSCIKKRLILIICLLKIANFLKKRG